MNVSGSHPDSRGHPLSSLPSVTTSPPERQYSAYSERQKQCIIALVAFAGWFSSLSSFIYFPAIPDIAADLGVSTEAINLSVTAYLVMSGIFPAIIGSTADTVGRRPVFIGTLAVYIGANVGLALQSSLGLLLFLRMLQSAGISGSYAVTYGVIGDLFTPAERGGYSGIVSFVLNTPPSIGPVISGLLLMHWGWRSIFWFLAIISPCCLCLIALFLPETSRSLVQNGSILPSRWNRPVFTWLLPAGRAQTKSLAAREQATEKTKPKIPNPLKTLVLLYDLETGMIIGTVAVYYATYSCLQASLSTLFASIYGVSGIALGLVYLPFGIGCAISALLTGLSQIQHHYYRSTCVVLILVWIPKQQESSMTSSIGKSR